MFFQRLAIGPFFLKNGAESALYYTFMMKTKKGSMSHFIENKKKKLKVRQNTTDRTTMDVKEPAYKNLHSKPVFITRRPRLLSTWRNVNKDARGMKKGTACLKRSLILVKSAKMSLGQLKAVALYASADPIAFTCLARRETLRDAAFL